MKNAEKTSKNSNTVRKLSRKDLAGNANEFVDMLILGCCTQGCCEY